MQVACVAPINACITRIDLVCKNRLVLKRFSQTTLNPCFAVTVHTQVQCVQRACVTAANSLESLRLHILVAQGPVPHSAHCMSRCGGLWSDHICIVHATLKGPHSRACNSCNRAATELQQLCIAEPLCMPSLFSSHISNIHRAYSLVIQAGLPRQLDIDISRGCRYLMHVYFPH